MGKATTTDMDTCDLKNKKRNRKLNLLPGNLNNPSEERGSMKGGGATREEGPERWRQSGGEAVPGRDTR